MDRSEIFSRTALAAGNEMMSRLATARVMIFGVGGVGSWCAEALVRSGIGHLTIVDSDVVAASNINRQLMATVLTVGQPKVEALSHRLLEINPDLDITAIRGVYDRSTAYEYRLEDYDYVIDAIDSLDCKAMLICEATSKPGVTFFSSMGAALRLSASKITTAEFWKVEGCPLARALRQKFRRTGIRPARKFKCVYSPEVLRNRCSQPEPDTPTPDDTWSARKAVINGTFAHTTAIFGLTLAGLVIEDLYTSTNSD